jgi:hypothetical protein
VALAIPFGLYGTLPLFAGSCFRIPGDLVLATVLTVGTWLAGQGARRWRRQSHGLATALEEVEAARAAHAELAVQAERTRLVRELHDIVAIESTGREALVEMRRLLGVLRSSPHRARRPAWSPRRRAASQAEEYEWPLGAVEEV